MKDTLVLFRSANGGVGITGWGVIFLYGTAWFARSR